MKLLIASDLHGSSYFVEKLVQRIEAEQPDKILLLGDLLYHGPRNALPSFYDTKAVATYLNDRKNLLLCVRGNCDTEVDQMVLDFPILADYCMLDLDGHTLFATHGHHYNRENLPPMGTGEILLHGHTHIPENSVCGDIRILNPGSVSIPKGGSQNSYMIYEKGTFCWKNLDGEVYDTLSL